MDDALVSQNAQMPKSMIPKKEADISELQSTLCTHPLVMFVHIFD